MATAVTTSGDPSPSARQPLHAAWRLCVALSLTALLLAWEDWNDWPSSLRTQAVVCLAFISAQAALFRRYWPGLGGPVLFYDMLRVSRRGRYVFLRLIYGTLLFSILGFIAQRWLQYVPTPTANDLASLANACLATIVSLQFIAVIGLMPAYAAGAITDERERRTLEYLLTTDLTAREIVFGKFISRLANMTMLLLVGLPVVSLLQLLGGVDLGLLLMAFAATVVFMLSVAALSLLCSVRARRSRGAIVEAYLLLAAYLLVLPVISEVLRMTGTGVRTGVEAGVLHALQWLNAGNPFYVFTRLTAGAGPSTQLATSFALFAAFHALVTIACLWLAVRRFPRVSRRTISTPAKRRSLSGRSRRVWGPPVLWKEMQIRGLPRVKPRQRAALVALVVLTMIVCLAPLMTLFAQTHQRWRTEDSNSMLRIYFVLLSCILLIAIILKSSAAFTGERARQTLDVLLTTPLSAREILWGKWLGSILSVRYVFIWLAAISVLGLTTHGLHPVALIWLLAAGAIYAAACASMGLYASVVARSSMQANLAAFALIACFTLAQATLVVPARSTVAYVFNWGNTFRLHGLPESLPASDVLSFIPPVTVARLTFSDREWESATSHFRLTLILVLFSLNLWLASALCFYWLARWSFGRQRARIRAAARAPVKRPETNS